MFPTVRFRRMVALVIVIMFSLGFVLSVPWIPEARATGSPALDGNAVGSGIGGNCTWSQKLTTTEPPDVIVISLVINDTTTTVTGVKDTASLAWTPRTSERGPTDVQIFSFYSIAPKQLFADSINFTLSSRAVAMICQAFGISGADTAAPFDPNSAMPNTNRGNSTITNLNYTTTNPDDFLVILEGFCAQGPSGSGLPSGFAPFNGAQRASDNCAINDLQSVAYSQIVSSAQSARTVSWTFDTQYSPFAIIGDAISPRLTLTTVTCASPVIVNQGAICNLTVTDISPGMVSTPTGTVTLASNSTGTLAPASSCTLAASATLGTASCSVTYTPSVKGHHGISGSYAGDSTHSGSATTTAFTVTVTPRNTSTSVSCLPASVSAGQKTLCVTTVTDTSPGMFITPTGAVGLSQTGVTGAFTTCTLTGTTVSAMCSSTFTASTIGTAAVTASYPGDSPHSSSSGTTRITVSSDLSILSFVASPTSLSLGEKVTFTVSTSGGYGALSYSYTNLPASCFSTNATTLSCTPTSGGNYDVTVRVTDQAGETATATVSITTSPQKVIPQPQTIGLPVIFGVIVGISAIVIFSVALLVRWKKTRQAPTAT